MSEESKGLNETPESSNANTQEAPESKSEEVVNDAKAVLAKNRELLGKNKDLSKRLQDLEEKLQQTQQTQLEEQGKYKELYQERDRQYKELKANNAYAHLQIQVSSKASSLGCVDPELLMNVIDVDGLASSMDAQTFRVDDEILQASIEKVKSERPHLFKVSGPSVGSHVPNTSGVKPPKAKNPKDLGKDDLVAQIKLLHGKAHG